MEIITFDAPAKVNPYTEDVAALIKATETNPKAAGTFIVPTKDEGKTIFKIQRAAIDQDRTASIALVEQGDKPDTVRIVIRIKPKHQSKPRGPRGPNKPKSEAVKPTSK